MENPECPECCGPGVALGQLGRLMHFRCRNCGMQFSEVVEENPDNEDPDADREEDE